MKASGSVKDASGIVDVVSAVVSEVGPSVFESEDSRKVLVSYSPLVNASSTVEDISGFVVVAVDTAVVGCSGLGAAVLRTLPVCLLS